MPEPDPSPMPAEVPPGPIARAARPLAIAVTVLLFAQWPLRDAVGAGSLLANDVAQILFALYVAVAVPYATARGAHLAAAPERAMRSRRRRIAGALVPLPWCVWLLVAGLPPAWQSVRQLEGFPETFNPGYFLIKVAMVLLGVLLAWQCLRDARRAWR